MKGHSIMKILSKLTVVIAISVVTMGLMQHKVCAEESSFIRVPVGISYNSVYWWRGVELNGKGVGVFWPSVGLELGETGFALSVAAGVNEDYLIADDSTDRDAAKPANEFDYGIAYGAEFGIVSLGAGVMYIHYPFYDEVDNDAVDPSFWEASVAVGLDILLAPSLEIYYDYYVEEDDATDNPVNEDYYVKASIGHDVIKTDSFSFSLGAWVAYYNNAYLDKKGWSDAGISLGTSSEYKGISFDSAFYYARSLDEDFQEANGAGKLKNHFWAEFGVSTSL
jgi:hypothetical protein